MVVKMQRLDVMLYHKERDRFLAGLKKLGVVHIVEDAHAVDVEEILRLAAEVRRAERVIACLKKLRHAAEHPLVDKSVAAAPLLIARYEALDASVDRCAQEIASLEKERDALEPWGDFDRTSIAALERAGVRIRFFIATEKTFASIDRTETAVEVVAIVNEQVHFVVVERAAEASSLPCDEVLLPERSLSTLVKTIAQQRAAMASLQSDKKALAAALPRIESYLHELIEQSAYKRVLLSMPQEVDGKVLLLHGWVPVTVEERVQKFLDNAAVWYAITKPTARDAVPILVKNGPFARLFEPLLKIYDLPDYFEFDPTPFFAPFFMLFVGLCLGDVAYGLILAITGTVATFKAAPPIRPIALLIVVLGLSTTFAGVLLNSCFGHTIFGGPGIPEGSAFFSKGATLFSPLCPTETAKGQLFPMMSFALVIGMLQLFVAMILRGINQIMQGNILGSLQPFSSFLMVLSAFMTAAHAKMLSIDTLAIGPLHVGKLLTIVPSSAVNGLLVLSFVLFFFFNNLQLKLMFRPLMGLWEFYQFASGIVTYLLSYIRLFALGLSGGLLAAAFNYIAFMFITKDGQITYASPMIVFTIIVLVIGHAINLSLSLIGSFVHPLRLTFVEFYSTLGFKGGGKPYMPFKHLQTIEKSQ